MSLTNKKVVLVDLDGTVALNSHRHHFLDNNPPDWDGFFLNCDLDRPNHNVIDIVNSLFSLGYKIHIFSGRGMIAHSKTIKWLAENRVSYSDLTMRAVGCRMPDEELKKKWLEEYYPNYKESVVCVFDDRNKVVNMWRSLGLTCFQVAEGDF